MLAIRQRIGEQQSVHATIWTSHSWIWHVNLTCLLHLLGTSSLDNSCDLMPSLRRFPVTGVHRKCEMYQQKIRSGACNCAKVS